MSEPANPIPTSAPPEPVIEKRRFPIALIWVVPIIAALMAAYYYRALWLEHSGTMITLRVPDASGIKINDTQVLHLGVPIGKVSGLELTPDNKRVLVRIRLQRGADAFAKKGAAYWIVRPEVSAESVTGLGTLFSGPTIEAEPGSGDGASEFVLLSSHPVAVGEGVRFVLRAPRRGSIQPGSPIYYHGIDVGVVEDVQLSTDAAVVKIPIFIRKRYAPLVRTDSVFWTVGGADIQGGIFTGVRVRVESLRSLLAGGVTFATPTRQFGGLAPEGTEFSLADEAKKEWSTWSPTIALPPIGDDTP